MRALSLDALPEWRLPGPIVVALPTLLTPGIRLHEIVVYGHEAYSTVTLKRPTDASVIGLLPIGPHGVCRWSTCPGDDVYGPMEVIVDGDATVSLLFKYGAESYAVGVDGRTVSVSLSGTGLEIDASDNVPCEEVFEFLRAIRVL